MNTMTTSLAAALMALAAPAFAQDGESVRITASDGMVLPIGQDIASVLVADPDVADVQPLSEQTLFLFGKSRGATRLFVLDSDDEIVFERRVVVTGGLQDLRRADSNL